MALRKGFQLYKAPSNGADNQAPRIVTHYLEKCLRSNKRTNIDVFELWQAALGNLFPQSHGFLITTASSSVLPTLIVKQFLPSEPRPVFEVPVYPLKERLVLIVTCYHSQVFSNEARKLREQEILGNSKLVLEDLGYGLPAGGYVMIEAGGDGGARWIFKPRKENPEGVLTNWVNVTMNNEHGRQLWILG